MSISSRKFGSSSIGAGIRVTLADGKRFEDFLNNSLNWYYAAEAVVGSSFNDTDLKAPELGELTIYERRQDKEDTKKFVVAVFPKGSWEFVRVLETEKGANEK